LVVYEHEDGREIVVGVLYIIIIIPTVLRVSMSCHVFVYKLTWIHRVTRRIFIWYLYHLFSSH